MSINDPQDLEPITARAWPAARQRRLGDWTLYATEGHSLRINSCWVSGEPGLGLQAALDEVEAWYERQDRAAIFKCAYGAGSDQPLAQALMDRGYVCGKETLVMVGPITGAAVDDEVSVSSRLDAVFGAVFAATATDPADSAERLAALGRIPGPRFFARLEVAGQPAAIGASAVEGQWAGIFGMRTTPTYRRQGYGARILETLLAKARQAGATKAYLQVEAANLGAIPIYQRAGFEVAYRYCYWTRLAAH
jgi:GNAT superfamily N-acetyltransferase